MLQKYGRFLLSFLRSIYFPRALLTAVFLIKIKYFLPNTWLLLVLHNRYPSYCNLDRLIMTFEHFSIVQITEQLNLNLATLQQELESGKINVKNLHRTLRQNFPHNDEKIFVVVTIALKFRFTPPLSNLNLKGN